MDGDDSRVGMEGNVDTTRVGSGAAGGLEEGGDESTVVGQAAEVGPRKILEKNVVAEDIGEVAGIGAAGRAEM